MAGLRRLKTDRWQWYGPAAGMLTIGLALFPVAAYVGYQSAEYTAESAPLLNNELAYNAGRNISIRSEIDSYGTLAGMFGEPERHAAGPPIEVKKPLLQQLPAPPPDPLADYLFTGAVTVDGRTFALLEHRKTKDGVYVAVGDEFHGFTVSGIGVDGVTLIAGGDSRHLVLNDEYRMTPFSADAETTERSVQVVDGGVTNYEVTFTNWISEGYMLYKGGGDTEQLKNEVFEGKMTLEEYNKRAGSDGRTTWGKVRLIDASAEALFLGTRLYRTSQ